MLDKDRVYEAFLLYSDLEEEKNERLRAISDRAADNLAARLSDKAEAGAHMNRLCGAAAGIAWCDLLAREAGVAEEIRVGDVSMRSSSSYAVTAKELDALREGFLADIADLLSPPFVLGRVAAC
ncbi:MAG: hypothetical protein LBU86_06160 [Oscillospiraceae bacterium]|jgi:hypothetical protein|nr:hypothetical protein [Oscillospiraceae bacterium]